MEIFDWNCICLITDCDTDLLALSRILRSIVTPWLLIYLSLQGVLVKGTLVIPNFYSRFSYLRGYFKWTENPKLFYSHERTTYVRTIILIWLFSIGSSKNRLSPVNNVIRLRWNCTDRGVFIGWFSRRLRGDRNVRGRIFESWLGSVSSTIGVDGIQNLRVL